MNAQGMPPRHQPNSRRTLRQMMNSLERGLAAEQRAAEHLQAQGLIVLARNLRCRAGELDLVGLDGDVLAVVEIRQRSRIDFGGAPGSVTQRKQRKIIRAVRYFLTQEPAWRGLRLRFDVVSIEGAQRIAWLKDAFRAT
jgi:putative endonuclease